MKKILKMFLLVLIVFCLLTTSVSVMARDNKNKNFSGFVDIGGYSIYVEKSCVNKGNKPTIVFETGYGDSFNNAITSDLGNSGNGITAIREAVKSMVNVVAYDRAGLGKSDISSMSRTSVNKAKELHNVLRKLGIKKNIIFVAHSIGGFTVRLYADMYPGEISGILMIDASHEDQLDFIQKAMDAQSGDGYFESMKPYFFPIPEDGNWDTYDQSKNQIIKSRKHNALRNIPLTVIYASDHGMGSDVENQLKLYQKDLASLSKDSKLIEAIGGHYIYLDKPQLIIDEILLMINKITNKK